MSRDQNTTTTNSGELIFGQVVDDRHRWLEDGKAPEVTAWLTERDRRARASLSAIPERTEIGERLAEVMYVSSFGIPSRRGGALFSSVRKASDEKFVYYVREGNQPERVLIDPHRLSSDGSLRVSGVAPSRDGKLVGYLEQPNSADEATIRIARVDTGELQARDNIAGVRYTSIGWNRDSTGFYYTWLPPVGAVAEEQRLGHAQPRFHRLGSDPSEDVALFPPTGDASKFSSAHESYDGQYTIVSVQTGWDKSQVFLRPTDHTRGASEQSYAELASGKDALFSATVHRGHLYVHTNLDAPRFRLFKTKVGALEPEHWQEVVAESEGVLEGFEIVGEQLALQYTRSAHSQLVLTDLDGKNRREVALPTLGSVTAISGLPDSDEAYFAFGSFTHPTEIYRLDVKTGSIARFAGDDAKVDVSQFQVEQVWYPSKDGTSVSMFIVSKKNLELNGKNPTLLSGYGGFSASMTPWFSPDLFVWLERGGVYALANLRGGGEYGEEWHRAGMRENKQNVFDDFIAAAEYLTRRGYTQPRQLGIRGGSNGGLLVGAAMTQRPDLFGAVVCSVPLLDMVRYHRFGLGRAWIPEYGDPDVEAEFRWLYAYSPYHQVREGVTYPPLLMMSADTDDRVDPMHARKFVARLEEVAGPESNEALLWVERNAGHGGADLRRAQVERRADEYAFLWRHLQPRTP